MRECYQTLLILIHSFWVQLYVRNYMRLRRFGIVLLIITTLVMSLENLTWLFKTISYYCGAANDNLLMMCCSLNHGGIHRSVLVRNRHLDD